MHPSNYDHIQQRRLVKCEYKYTFIISDSEVVSIPPSPDLSFLYSAIDLQSILSCHTKAQRRGS